MGGNRLIRTFSLLSVLLFSANLLLFSVQSFIPPSVAPSSLAYTKEYCTSHKSGQAVSVLISLFDGSDKKEGNEKHCFCYSCCLKRQYFINVLRETLPLRTEQAVYGRYHEETFYLKDFAKNLSSRSPPFSLV